MLEKVSQLAEHVATSVSRRDFLGRFGKGALAVAATVGGLLALPHIAQAGPRGALCGGGSHHSCWGKKVGDPCDGRVDGAPGVCRQYGRTACTCL